MEAHTFRVAATADLHYGREKQPSYSWAFSDVGETADALLLCGDLLDHGLPAEARMLAKDLAPVVQRIPVLGVLGNHEFESGEPDQVSRILKDGGVRMLDGESCEIHGIGFAGVKGFAGGFGERKLGPWGEKAIKLFVREASVEAMKLESALAALQTPQRVALLHYAPVRATVVGEHPEIFPFLGSSRLEEPLDRHSVSAVFHGHAHNGSLEGKTSGGVPVYNVAARLLERSFPERPPFRVVELPRERKARP